MPVFAHLPWWYPPCLACFVCRRRLDWGELSSHTHEGTPLISERNVQEVVHWSLGLLHFLKEHLGVESLPEFCRIMREQNVVITPSPPLVEARAFRYLRVLIRELYDPLRHLEGPIFPPQHFTMVLHWANLAALIAYLPLELRAPIRELADPRDLAGNPVHYFPPLPPVTSALREHF